MLSCTGAGRCVFGQSKGSGTVPEVVPSKTETASVDVEPKPEKRKGGRQKGPVKVGELSAAEQNRMQMQMMGADFHSKGGVGYRKSWEFRSGVTKLYPPYYDGWENARGDKELFEYYAKKGEPGYALSSIIYSDRYVKQTGSEFINYFILIWVPQTYAFSLFTPRSFGKFKETVREGILEARKDYADRDKFESFQDYIAFKFGRDDEMENFADGYWIEANEGEEHLTYFYTSEFIGTNRKRKEAFKRPLIGTATYLLVRDKLIKLDVVKEYVRQDDIPILLEFTANIREDMRTVNRFGESD